MFNKCIIDIRKLSEYCLNPHHPVGKHKARVFFSALGIHDSDAQWLKDQILIGIETLKDSSLEWGLSDEFGKRFSVDLELKKEKQTAIVRTIWIVKTDTNTAELITCYVLS